MASLSGPVGKFNEELMAGRLEEANRALQEASKQDLIDARYAFTELVAVMSGTSPLARTYEEVTQDQKDVEISVALTGAFKSHRELQRTEGPTRWNRAAWRQNFEVPAEAIVRRSATDTNFATETSSFMSSDIMLDLGNLRDAAAPNGVNISISENGQVVISATDQAAPLQGATVGVARRPITPGDKLRTFTEENKAIIDDINYKMTVLGRLGDVGQSTMDILRAEVPSAETTTRAGGAGSGSSSTSTSSIVSVVDAGKGFTTVRRSDGTVEKLEGTRAWRNNNPGNIEYGEFAKSSGAVGSDGRFAVFPSYEAGRAAKKKLLWDTKGYSGKTIAEAINRYAPPSENDTNAYTSTVSSAVGVPVDTPMSSLSEDQKEAMLDAMERVEGFRAGQASPASGGTTEAQQGRPSDANAVASRAGEATQRAVTATSGAPMTMPSGGAPAAPVTTGEVVVADATLPEAIPAETPTGGQGASELSPAISVDKDVQAFIQEIAGDPDKTYASAEEFTAAQERGELEPGDTVVVNEEIYVIRKDGSARKLGSLTP
jgi:hypothetical protein